MRFYVKRKRTPQIIIVSLIDIFAILLIFFIVTTTFKTAQSQLSINVPQSQSAVPTENPSEPLVLSITGDKKIRLGDQEIAAVEELGAALKKAKEAAPERALAMNADQEVPFGFLVSVMDQLKEAGIKNLPAFTRPKEEK
jgi:biopolymer transport protein ExbD